MFLWSLFSFVIYPVLSVYIVATYMFIPYVALDDPHKASLYTIIRTSYDISYGYRTMMIWKLFMTSFAYLCVLIVFNALQRYVETGLPQYAYILLSSLVYACMLALFYMIIGYMYKHIKSYKLEKRG
jgi:hypothetical protein